MSRYLSPRQSIKRNSWVCFKKCPTFRWGFLLEDELAPANASSIIHITIPTLPHRPVPHIRDSITINIKETHDEAKRDEIRHTRNSEVIGEG